MMMRIGGIDYPKRLKKLNYLQGFNSRKKVYNICEEATIDKLYRDINKNKKQSQS